MKKKHRRTKNTKQESRAVNVPAGFLTAVLIVCGGYYEWVSAALSVGLTGFLVFRHKKSGELTYPYSFGFAALCLIPLFALCYAVDRGEAFTGFFKFLPFPLFPMVCGQAGKRILFSGRATERLFRIPQYICTVSVHCSRNPMSKTGL